MMDNQYLCPQCRGHLRVGEYIIFRIRNSRREKGLLLLHPEVGNYTSIKHPQFRLAEGERMDFFCPICLQSLDADLDENLVHVVMIDKSKTEQKIYFSRIAGEKSTYKVSDEGITACGEHSHRYTIFKFPEKLTKYLHS
jgi:hypothetical protein